MIQAADRQKITLAFFLDPDSNVYMKWGELLYTDAFSRLNIDFSYTVMPAIRASRMADLGKVDGEAGRSLEYSKVHTNLIRITEPLTTDNISAFTDNPAIKIYSWDDLKNPNYKVEYYRGMLLTAHKLKQLISPENLTDSSTPAESLRKLLHNRIDIFIGSEPLTKKLLATPEFSNTNIKMLATLEATSTYGYLHKRHSELAIKLAEIFRQMKSEGTFDAYYQQAKEIIDLQTTPSNIVD